jgi:hypothetical protein
VPQTSGCFFLHSVRRSLQRNSEIRAPLAPLLGPVFPAASAVPNWEF